MKKLLLFIFLCLFTAAFADGKSRLKMVFRYDDYTLMTFPLNDTLLNVFKRNKIPLTLGIIPFDENSSLINQFDHARLEDLKSRIKRGEIEVALHGFNHKNIIGKRFLKRKYYSEFATENYDRQYYEIKRGKKVLDSLLNINIQTFIPPFDTYDGNTLDVLTDLGIKTISASIFSATSGVSGNARINYMPATIRDFSEIQGILSKYKDEDVTIILYFHPYSFRSESLAYSDDIDPSRQITPARLDTLLRWVSRQDINFYTFSTLAETGNFNKTLYNANFYKDNLVKAVLYKFKKYRYGIYSTLGYHTDHKGLFIGNLLLHLGIFLVVYFVVSGLVRLYRPRTTVMTMVLAAMILSVCSFLYYFVDDSSFMMKLVILAVIVIAAILGTLRGNKKLFFTRPVVRMIF